MLSIPDSWDRIEAVAAELGLDGPYQQQEYVERMERKFGREASRFMDACDRQLAGGMNSPEVLYRLSAPIVLAICVTHEMFADDLDQPRESCDSERDAVRLLVDHVARDGALITVNRFPFPARQLPKLDGLVAANGLAPEGDPLGLVIPLQGGRADTLPVRLYRRAST